MKYLNTYESFVVLESNNYKSLPEDTYKGALAELNSEESIDTIDDLFAFIDYWICTCGDLPHYNPDKTEKFLASFYEDDWFPMYIDDDTIEAIMNELSSIYQMSTFKPGPYQCIKCGSEFKQNYIGERFCSQICKDDYDKTRAEGILSTY